MSRTLDTVTLDNAAMHYASEFLRPDLLSKSGERFVGGRAYVEQDFYNFTFRDEFDYMLRSIRGQLGENALSAFDEMAENKFGPRGDETFEKLLAEKLAIDPDGNHIDGRIGTVQFGARHMGSTIITVETPESLMHRKRLGLSKFDSDARQIYQKVVPHYWPIYAGEVEERLNNSQIVTPLPDGTPGLPVGALNTRISNECAQLGANAIVDNLDEGAGAAIIRGHEGAQPTDPDTAPSGTVLFTLVCSDPAFTAATDGAPGGLKTADTITDESSAVTGTLGYCRASSTADGATPADNHIDGEAGTSGADFNFNTLAIVTGATVSMTSWTVTMPES